jgi:MFS transporter, UMF1 family
VRAPRDCYNDAVFPRSVTKPVPAEYSVREQRAWYVYDWANSAFAVSVVAMFYGPYLTAIAKAGAGPDGFIRPFGIAIDARSFWSYMVSLSVALQVLVLPITGAIADYGRRKKECLAGTAYVGSAATIAMFFLKDGNYMLGGALFLIANIAFGASLVVYNSFLPEIAPPDQRDAVSSKGWAVGYAGGGVLLALNILLYSRAASFGIDEALAVRISLCSAGVWWAVFTIPTLIGVHNRGPARAIPPGKTAIGAAIGQLAHTIRDIRRYPQTLRFLLAYLLYNDAIQTVLSLATQFGSDELKIPISQLTILILMVQFVAMGGALGFDWLAARTSAKKAIAVSLIIWVFVPAYIYAFVHTAAEFFAMGALVAIVMGGSQALSRSLFAQFIPKGSEAEYFGVYEISDKGTSWLCPILFGLALQFTGSYRTALLSLIVFFVAGLLMLFTVDVAKGQRDVVG